MLNNDISNIEKRQLVWQLNAGSFKKFKELYKFVFDFSRDPGYKNLNVETAVGLWQLLLDSKCSFLNIWVDFITKEKKDLQVITKDIWNMLYELNE